MPLLITIGFLIPVTGIQFYAVKLVDPARVGILFQSEAVFGIASAAVLTAEPFGWPEATGAALVLSASFVEIVINRPGSARRRAATDP